MTRVFAPEDAVASYDYNPLYSPEKCGLEIVVTLDDEDLSYEYDTIIVVRDIATGELYAAHDSGCSCPTPFEDFTSLDKFVEIRSEDDFSRLVGGDEYAKWKPADVLEAARKIREALAK